MSPDILVSIIINNYNYGRFLRAAICSALHQSHPRTEVIVVDDGSSDASREIIAEYGDQLVAVLKENGGQASACNAGFAHSHGDVVIFLDADDVLLPTTAGCVAKTFAANPNAAKIQYRMEVVDASGTPTGRLKPPPHIPLLSGDLRWHYLTFPDDVMRMATSANAFPATILRQVMPIPEPDYRAGADTYLAHVTPLFGPVISLSDIGAYYRVHGANGYEVTSLNMDRIRRNITHARQTHTYIQRFADQLNLPTRRGRANDILAVSFVANRMTSLKLAAAQHPIRNDRLCRLSVLGMKAAFRRFDVPMMMKLVFAGWFLAMLLAPRPLAWWLAEQFFFPEARGAFGSILSRLHPEHT
jgi:hypothetical protein